jgi:hypothetical protein
MLLQKAALLMLVKYSTTRINRERRLSVQLIIESEWFFMFNRDSTK